MIAIHYGKSMEIPLTNQYKGTTECFEPADMLFMWRNVPLDQPHDLPGDSPYSYNLISRIEYKKIQM